MSTDIVIVAAARTAVGKFGGTLAKTAAPELGATVIRALLERSGLAGEQIGEVILGQVLAAGSGQNPARQSVIKSGLPAGVPAMTINTVCGSGTSSGTAKGVRGSGSAGPLREPPRGAAPWQGGVGAYISTIIRLRISRCSAWQKCVQ